MAITDDVRPYRAPADGGRWPAFAEVLVRYGEYPYGRGARQGAPGWQCPGCGSCYAPWVARCSECGPKTLAQRISANDPAVRLSRHTCPEPLEGGMCGCPEGDTP